MTYNFNDLDDITIEYQGCSIFIPYSPHPSIQRWKLKYRGVESEGVDPSLSKIVNLIFSEEGVEKRLTNKQETNLNKYLDEFVSQKIKNFSI